jgi:hypothetical protein
VPLSVLEYTTLEGDLAPIVARLPTASGVGQLLGPQGRNLILARASNLRKWASSHLGLGDPPPPGRRPKTNLAGIATALGWARTVSPFGQRLLYERMAAPLIPLADRRDLKPPAFLHLDPRERFPRVTLSDGAGPTTFGPFRSRRQAEQARDAVNRRFRLRPCDYVFEPDPALSLGLGCLFAQVRSCAAPCLARLSEGDYRGLAAEAAAWLAGAAPRIDAPAEVPDLVSAVEGSRALVIGVGRKEVEIYPVWEGRVQEENAACVTPADLAPAIAGLQWGACEGPADWPWLADWITSSSGRGSWVPVRDPSDRAALAAAVWKLLPSRFAAPAGGGNVGASKGGE